MNNVTKNSTSNTAKKNILILFGGGGTEHRVSKLSAEYLISKIKCIPDFNSILVEINKDGIWEQDTRKCSLVGRILKTPTEQPYIDYVIPCFHGSPGETGEIQAFLDQLNLPYFGVQTEGSIICFNKIITKMWLDHLKIPNSPWIFFNKQLGIDKADEVKALEFYDTHRDIFIKAANQGSSVGCYHITNKNDVIPSIQKAFKYSDNVLLERTFRGRELEVAVFEHEGKLHITEPGEIICPDGFYDYDEKYSQDSKTKTLVVAQNIKEELKKEMMDHARVTFKALGLRHLSRIDFFYNEDGISLNEINTFPGMTPISMFPKMLENTGLSFESYLEQIIKSQTK